jgi:hypothetical protein
MAADAPSVAASPRRGTSSWSRADARSPSWSPVAVALGLKPSRGDDLAEGAAPRRGRGDEARSPSSSGGSSADASETCARLDRALHARLLAKLGALDDDVAGLFARVDALERGSARAFDAEAFPAEESYAEVSFAESLASTRSYVAHVAARSELADTGKGADVVEERAAARASASSFASTDDTFPFSASDVDDDVSNEPPPPTPPRACPASTAPDLAMSRERARVLLHAAPPTPDLRYPPLCLRLVRDPNKSDDDASPGSYETARTFSFFEHASRLEKLRDEVRDVREEVERLKRTPFFRANEDRRRVA